MKKRIGSRIYDTESAELLKETELGKLYRKRTRDRECFIVSPEGAILSMPDDEARDWLDEDLPPKRTGSSGYFVRIDRETHEYLDRIAEARGMSIVGVVRQLVKDAAEDL